MKGKIDIQQIPESRLEKGYPAYFYEEGYLFDAIEKIVKNKKELCFEIDFKTGIEKHKFSAEDASEFVLTYNNKVYPLISSQWDECLDNDWYEREKELEFKINKDGFAEVVIEPISLGATNRGFTHGEFEDDYGSKCSIQMSSIATRRCIWLGLDDANPLIMSPNGWTEYSIPPDVLLHTRMHLTREDVKKILPLLIKFSETGEL